MWLQLGLLVFAMWWLVFGAGYKFLECSILTLTMALGMTYNRANTENTRH